MNTNMRLTDVYSAVQCTNCCELCMVEIQRISLGSASKAKVALTVRVIFEDGLLGFMVEISDFWGREWEELKC
jgi:hypothetical protein